MMSDVDDELSLDGAVNENGESVAPVKRSVNPRFVTPDRSSGADTSEFAGSRTAPRNTFPQDKSVPAEGVLAQTPEAPVAPAETKPRVANTRFVLPGESAPVRRSPAPAFADDADAITLDHLPREGSVAAPVVSAPALASDAPAVDAEDAQQEGTTLLPTRRVASNRFNFKQVTPPAGARNRFALGGDVSASTKPDALFDADDADSFDEKKRKDAAPKRRKRFNMTERDIILLRFLVRYQFSYVEALARLLDSSPQTVAARLRTLEQYDLVKRQVIAHGATLWSARKAGIELVGLNFVENKKEISFATIQHTIGLVNLAVELEREAGGKDILGLQGFNEQFPVFNRFPSGIRVYGEEELEEVQWQMGEMTVCEREIRQGQKRWRGGRSTREMRDLVELAIQTPEGPELEEGNEGLYVVYGQGGATGEHVPDLVVQRPRRADGSPGHFAIELELSAKSPADWKRILRSFRDSGGMYERVYYFTDKKPIANMIRNADEEVGLGSRLVIRRYTPRNKRQPFLG